MSSFHRNRSIINRMEDDENRKKLRITKILFARSLAVCSVGLKNSPFIKFLS